MNKNTVLLFCPSNVFILDILFKLVNYSCIFNNTNSKDVKSLRTNHKLILILLHTGFHLNDMLKLTI